MIATDQMDYNALKWVKGEIDVNLQQARHVLETFCLCSGDDAQVQSCVALLHEVHGALKMLDLTGLAALAEATGHAVSAMGRDSSKCKTWAYETLARAITSLSESVARLQEGRHDTPKTLLPLINDLRVAAGMPPLSESMVFGPDALSVINPSHPETEDAVADDMTVLAQRLRPVYQAGLLVWYRDSGNKAALRRLMQVVTQLQQSCPEEGLWMVAEGLIERLLKDALEVNPAIKLLLGQVERQIGRVAASGAQDLRDHPPAELIKNLLYYIAYADTKSAPAMEGAMAVAGQSSPGQGDSPAAANPILLEMAADAVKEELAWAKDKLDEFARAGGRHTPRDLRSIADVLKRVSNTFDMLGRWELRQRVRQQTGVIDTVIEEGTILNDPRLVEVANALVYVQSLLRDVPMPEDSASDAPDKALSENAALISAVEYHEIRCTVIRETMADMTRVKEDIMAFASAPAQYGLIASCPATLRRIIGVLIVLSLPRPATLLKSIFHYLRRDLSANQTACSQDVLNTLADVLTSVEFYLETLAESQMNLDSLLEMAEGQVATLGYPIDVVGDIPMDDGGADVSGSEGESAVIADNAECAVQAPEVVDQPMVIIETHALESIADAPVVEGVTVSMPADTAPAPVPGQDEDMADEVMEVFAEEAGEELTSIAENHTRWRQGSEDALKTIRRSFHTLKGSGRLVGAKVIGEVAWAIEHLLNTVIAGEIPAGPAIFDVVARAHAAMPGLLRQFQCAKGETDIDSTVQALIDEAQALSVPPRSAADEMEQPRIATSDDTSEHAPQSDPVLLEIFKHESQGRLAEVRNFINACSPAGRGRVTESLLRNLHTLQGSAHMAGFVEIADLSGCFEDYVTLLNRGQGEVTEDAMRALSEFVDVFHETLGLAQPLGESPEKAAMLERIAGLTRRAANFIADEEQSVTTSEELDRTARAAPRNDMDEVLAVFLEEAAEILGNIETLLRRWMREPGDREAVARLERELHTFKGSARTAGIAALGDLSHSFESLLRAIANGQVTVTDDIFGIFEQSYDRLQEMLEQAMMRQPVRDAQDFVLRLEALAGTEDGQDIPMDSEQSMVMASVTEELADALPVIEVERDAGTQHDREEGALVASEIDEADAVVLQASSPSVAEGDESPGGDAEPVWLDRTPAAEQIRVRADLLDHLVNQGGELSISRARLEQQVHAFRSGVAEMKQTVARMREQLRKLDIETEAQVLFRHQELSLQGQEFDPLEFDRYSLVQQLARGMMESVADLVSIEDHLDKQISDSEVILLQQARLNTELQEGMMRTRMLPFAGVVSRLRRVVRQTARDVGKQAGLHVAGADLEMDRTVLDRIIAPLEHMVRNAVDHGIESPADRHALGKPDMGSLTLRLSKEGVEMVLRLSDDGRGLNLPAIRRKAIERGLLQENAAIDDQSLMQFVLDSGFSTASQVTQVSGRGVGMDVVNSQIKQLGGSLYIESVTGQGSVFTIRLPVALSITKALIVRDVEQMYAIPHSSIAGVMRVSRATLERAWRGEAPAIEYGGVSYPLRALRDLLGEDASLLPPGQDDRHLLLMVHGGGQRAALRIDAFVESREIVVKSLGPQLSEVRGVMGATIMGDGGVALILDIPALLRMGSVAGHAPAPMARQNVSGSQVHGAGAVTVMVVDDSITVRKITSRLLERNQMQVLVAKDGVDALEVLQHHLPDIMLLDIEMPRMDGYELASAIRNDERLKHIPIIMITSRTGDKHREHALRIGVNEYLGKPYQEQELLDHVRRLTGRHAAERAA
ncbi:MAG: Hpt domain-containing protein [Gammaproteobacteria bacterium]|nr:Hpt domain-containing protein [Gammaproteobacteria bacterium]